MRVTEVQMSAFARGAQGLPTVTVAMQDADGAVTVLGDARTLLNSRTLTQGERYGVRNMVQAFDRMQREFPGLVAAGNGVMLLLRSNTAQARGPFATSTVVSVPSKNPLRRGDGTVLPLDVALHELMHVVQMRVSIPHGSQRLHGGLAEGIADAQAMLATRDWRVGEGYFGSAKGSGARVAIRDARGGARMLNPIVSDYRKVAEGNVEAHRAGGVVSRTFYEVAKRLGAERAQQLLTYLVTDRAAWRGGGSWSQAAQSIVEGAAQLWAGDASAQSAVEQAMRVTHLDEA